MQNSLDQENHMLCNIAPEKFQWIEMIGEGAFGKVFKCIHEDMKGKEFAIKRFVLNLNYSKKKASEKIKEITIEMNNLAKLKDNFLQPSSIPEYYGYFIEKDKYGDMNFCLVFEYYPINFRQFLLGFKTEKGKPQIIPFNTLKNIFEEFLLGMTYLQAIELSHRDLKPENLALNRDGKLKIIDFGFAKDISELIKSSKTENNENKFEMTIGGTENYMSPEILNSFITCEKHAFNAFKSDIFSFGLIILEIGCLQKISYQRDFKSLEEKIDSLFKQFKKNYDLSGLERKSFKRIRRILRKCLDLQEDNRPDFEQIFNEYYDFHLIKEKKILQIFVKSLENQETQFYCEEIEKIRNSENKTTAKTNSFEEFEKIKKENEDLKKKLEKKQQKINDYKKELKEKDQIIAKLEESKKNEKKEEEKFAYLNPEEIEKFNELKNFKEIKNLIINQQEIKKLDGEECNFYEKSEDILLLKNFQSLIKLTIDFQERTFHSANDLKLFGNCLIELNNLETLNLTMKNKKYLWNPINDSNFLDLMTKISSLKSLKMLDLNFEINSLTAECLMKSKFIFKEGFPALKDLYLQLKNQFILIQPNFKFGQEEITKNYNNSKRFPLKNVYAKQDISLSEIEKIMEIISEKKKNSIEFK